MPPEPPNGSVVLGGLGVSGVPRAWQRIDHRADPDGRWVQAGGLTGIFSGTPSSKTWRHLVVDEPSLTLLHRAPEPDSDGWRDAGYTDQGCQSFTEPSAVDAPADGWRQAGYDGPACQSLAQTA